jgi:hypothetical protein
MTPRRHQMMAALSLRGQAERPPPASVREVRLLAPFSGNSPDGLSEQARSARLPAPPKRRPPRPGCHAPL